MKGKTFVFDSNCSVVLKNDFNENAERVIVVHTVNKNEIEEIFNKLFHVLVINEVKDNV